MATLLICPECGAPLERADEFGLGSNIYKCTTNCSANYYLLTRSVNKCPICQKIEIEIAIVSANEHRPITDNLCQNCQ